jgi:hypothetical protein
MGLLNELHRHVFGQNRHESLDERTYPNLAQKLKNTTNLNGFGALTIFIFFSRSLLKGGFGEDQFKFFPAMENKYFLVSPTGLENRLPLHHLPGCIILLPEKRRKTHN